jgi:hypothetical protein
VACGFALFTGGLGVGVGEATGDPLGLVAGTVVFRTGALAGALFAGTTFAEVPLGEAGFDELLADTFCSGFAVAAGE